MGSYDFQRRVDIQPDFIFVYILSLGGRSLRCSIVFDRVNYSLSVQNHCLKPHQLRYEIDNILNNYLHPERIDYRPVNEDFERDTFLF